MLFKPSLIEKIIRDEKTQTRRLVKPGQGKKVKVNNKEYIHQNVPIGPGTDLFIPGEEIIEVFSKNEKIKWRVGQDYAVQPGRGKKGVLHCGNKTCNFFEAVPKKLDYSKEGYGCWDCGELLKPFRIRITKIRREKLCDISEADAKAEGFKNKDEFIRYVLKLYWKKLPVEVIQLCNDVIDQEYRVRNAFAALDWNPEVWVLNFKVV